jgi:hypothetical protein
VTVKAEQGYRSIYLDKCVSFDHMVASNWKIACGFKSLLYNADR